MSDDPLPDNMPLTAEEVHAVDTAQREGQSAFAASIPGAKVVTVPGTTYYVQTQRPDAVLEAIRTAISETRPVPTRSGTACPVPYPSICPQRPHYPLGQRVHGCQLIVISPPVETEDRTVPALTEAVPGWRKAHSAGRGQGRGPVRRHRLGIVCP